MQKDGGLLEKWLISLAAPIRPTFVPTAPKTQGYLTSINKKQLKRVNRLIQVQAAGPLQEHRVGLHRQLRASGRQVQGDGQVGVAARARQSAARRRYSVRRQRPGPRHRRL